MSSNPGDSLNPVSSTTTSTCTPESNLLSDTQPILSDEEPSNRVNESPEDEQLPTTPKKSQTEELFCQLALELANEFPKVPAERCLKRSLAFVKPTDVWVQEESQCFETIVDTYSDEALKLVTEHKNLQDEVTKNTKQILDVCSSVTSEFKRLKELMARLQAIRNNKSTIASEQRLLLAMKREIDNMQVSLVPAEEPIKEACRYLDTVTISD